MGSNLPNRLIVEVLDRRNIISIARRDRLRDGHYGHRPQIHSHQGLMPNYRIHRARLVQHSSLNRIRVGKHLPQHRIHGQLGRTLALSTYPRPVPTCPYLMPLGLNTSSVGWNLQPEPPSCIHRCNAGIESGTTSLFWRVWNISYMVQLE